MSKAIIGDQLGAEMTGSQEIDAVPGGQATLKQMSEGLPDRPEELGRASQDSQALTDPPVETLPVQPERETLSERTTAPTQETRARRVKKPKKQTSPTAIKQRFGLPEGFAPSWQRSGQSVLLESNVYRLPNGQEFIASRPVGTLGARQHLYALLTSEQYLSGRRGSIYVRLDGRIFDYSVDRADPAGDIFDTGYTIYDLERTGRYAPVQRKKRKSQLIKHARAAAAGVASK
jgi:hypothetical protein